MKKSLAFVLALVMILALAACGTPAATTTTAPPAPSAAPTAAPTATPAPASAAPADTAPEFTIKLGYSTSGVTKEESPTVMYAAAFKEKLEELSGGKVKVDIYDGGQLGNDSDTTSQVSMGTTEMSLQSTSVIANYEPKIMCFDLAGVFNDVPAINEIFNSKWTRENIFDSLEEAADIRILSGYSRGFRSFASNTKELKTVGDIKGQTVRIMNNAMYVAIIESLSANPVAIAGGEQYNALQNGVVDAAENTIFSFWQDRTYEVLQWCVMDNHTGTPEAGFMNATFYWSLPDDYRKAVDEAAAYAVDKAEEVRISATETITQTLLDEGFIIYYPTEAEYATWHNAYKQASIDYISQSLGADFVNEFIGQVK